MSPFTAILNAASKASYLNIGIVMAIARGRAYFKRRPDFMGASQSGTVMQREAIKGETVTRSILCTRLALRVPFRILHVNRVWEIYHCLLQKPPRSEGRKSVITTDSQHIQLLKPARCQLGLQLLTGLELNAAG